MAFSKVPTDWIANYSATSTAVTLPLASFPEISSTEANSASGDIRQIVYGLAEGLYKSYATQSAAGNAPTKMLISKSGSVATSGSTPLTTYTYTFQFVTSSTATDVDNTAPL